MRESAVLSSYDEQQGYIENSAGFAISLEELMESRLIDYHKMLGQKYVHGFKTAY